jgi:hypothetical protein
MHGDGLPRHTGPSKVPDTGGGRCGARISSTQITKVSKTMGDWGPSYTARRGGAGASAPFHRCEECGMRFPGSLSGGDEACAFCGGRVRSGGGSQAAAAAPAQDARRREEVEAQVEAQASQILSAIAPGLMDAFLAGEVSRPADQTTLDELPLVKIEPYISLRPAGWQHSRLCSARPRAARQRSGAATALRRPSRGGRHHADAGRQRRCMLRAPVC